MEYQKIANFIDDASSQPFKFRTKNWVEINDESRQTYNVNSQIKFKTTMLKSSLCVPITVIHISALKELLLLITLLLQMLMPIILIKK